MFVNIHYFNVALLVGFLLYLSAFFYNHYTFDNDITPEIYQKNQGYLTCHSTLTNWNNWCDTKSAGVISSEIVIGNVFEETNDRWGNKLSVYWQMRAMAFLAGLPYKSKQNMTHWLQYLPTTYSAKYGGNCPTEFKAMCSLCVTDNHWQFPHRCLAQRYIIPEIINETRSALERYAKVHNKIIFEFFKDDVVIFTRCDSDTILSHSEYGPMPFSFYNSIPLSTKRIFFVNNVKAIYSVPICQSIFQSLIRRIQSRHSEALLIYENNYESSNNDVIFDDFVKLVYAPVLYMETSSFALQAGFANNGIINSPTLWSPAFRFDSPTWIWSDIQPLVPFIAQKENLTSSDDIVKWLNNH